MSKFVRWFDEKHGRERSGKDWVKVHLTCGVKTGVVTAAAIYDRDANDCPIMPELVRATAENFTIKEIERRQGLSVCRERGGRCRCGRDSVHLSEVEHDRQSRRLIRPNVPLLPIPPRRVLAHYHKRSNVESVFSSIKRKFGDNVRSRSDTAKVNEALAKLVCNNLCAVIMSQCELGIEPVFWHNNAAELEDRPDILRFGRPG